MGRALYQTEATNNIPEEASIGPVVNERLSTTIDQLSGISTGMRSNPEPVDWEQAGSSMLHQADIARLKAAFHAASSIKDKDEQTLVKVMEVIIYSKWALLTTDESASIAEALSALSGMKSGYHWKAGFAQRRLLGGTLRSTSGSASKQIEQDKMTPSDRSLNESLLLLAAVL